MHTYVMGMGKVQLARKKAANSTFLNNLEAQTSFASSVSQRPDSAVVPETSAIEAHKLDVLLLAKFCDFAADKLGCLFIVAATLSKLLTNLWGEGRCHCKGVTSLVVNYLCVNVVIRSENC